MSSRKDGPIFDDMGNLVRAPGGGAFINEHGNIEVRKTPDNRVVERNAGCYSCIHYDVDQVFDAKVQEAYVRAFAALKKRGLSDEVARRKTDAELRPLQAKGLIGVCTSREARSSLKPPGDFVAHRYLCRFWSGKTGASLARTPGEALSPLADEVKDKLGDDPVES